MNTQKPTSKSQSRQGPPQPNEFMSPSPGGTLDADVGAIDDPKRNRGTRASRLRPVFEKMIPSASVFSKAEIERLRALQAECRRLGGIVSSFSRPNVAQVYADKKAEFRNKGIELKAEELRDLEHKTAETLDQARRQKRVAREVFEKYVADEVIPACLPLLAKYLQKMKQVQEETLSTLRKLHLDFDIEPIQTHLEIAIEQRIRSASAHVEQVAKGHPGGFVTVKSLLEGVGIILTDLVE